MSDEPAVDFSPEPYPPLAADHPAIAMRCPICAKQFAPGDVTGPVPMPFIEMAHATDAEQPFSLFVRYRDRTEEALLAHMDCVVRAIAHSTNATIGDTFVPMQEVSERIRGIASQLPPMRNFERLIDDRFTLPGGKPTLVLACSHTMRGPDPDIPTLKYAVCLTCLDLYRQQLEVQSRYNLPTHCEACGTLLKGGATVHEPGCPWVDIINKFDVEATN